MQRRKVARQALARGMIFITDDGTASINHCNALDDNSFFTGVVDSKNAKIILNQSGDIFGSLKIELANSQQKLVEFWTSSLNRRSYDVLDWWGNTL